MLLGRAGRRSQLIRMIAPFLALFLFAGALPAQSDPPDQPGMLVASSLRDGRQLCTAKTAPVFIAEKASSWILCVRTLA